MGTSEALEERLAELAAGDDMQALATWLAQHQVVQIAYAGGTVPFPAFAAMLTKDKQVSLLRQLMADERVSTTWGWHRPALIAELSKRLPKTLPDDLAEEMLSFAVAKPATTTNTRLVQLVEWRRARGPLPPEVVELVKMHARSSARLSQLALELTGEYVHPGQPWADRVLADLPGLDQAWRGLLGHASSAVTGKPNAAWLATATTWPRALDPAKAQDVLAGWLRLVAPAIGDHWFNDDVLRGVC